MKPLNARPKCSRAADPRGGQAIILASLTMTVMFGTLGLATDLGWNYFLKTRVQTAADAAASAAAVYAAANTAAALAAASAAVCTRAFRK